MYHFDVYRIEEPEEMEEIGYEEYFYGQGVCLVEWASLVEEIIPPEAVWITIDRQCMMKMKKWSENYQTQKIHLLDTGYASAVSLSGNRYLVFIPQDLTDTMFKSYDKNKTLVGELFDDEFLVINDRDEQDHNCYFCGKVNAPFEIEK